MNQISQNYNTLGELQLDCSMFKRGYRELALSEDEASRIRKLGRNQPKYFNKVYVTVTAAAKMLSHAHFGEPREVMGLLQGSYYEENGHGVFFVADVIFLPVESSQTRVTADDETYTLIAAYADWTSKTKTHDIVGWYHSHPSFGCWLSGIDVNTQQLFQKSTDPFVALVVDPIKSANLQKVDIGAFRVHPQGYKEENTGVGKDVPRRKAVDFGYHYQRYYQLSVEFVANEIGAQTLKKVEKLEWVNELSKSSFFNQSQYLSNEANDEKLDIEQYLQIKENPSSKISQIKEKERSTLKKVAYYTKERNVSLIDSAIKNLLF